MLLPRTLNPGFSTPVKGVIRGQLCRAETLHLWTPAPHHRSTQAELVLLQTALNPPSSCLALPYPGCNSHHLSDHHCSLQHLSPPEACSPQGSPRSLSRTHLGFPPMALSMKKGELTMPEPQLEHLPPSSSWSRLCQGLFHAIPFTRSASFLCQFLPILYLSVETSTNFNSFQKLLPWTSTLLLPPPSRW